MFKESLPPPILPEAPENALRDRPETRRHPLPRGKPERPPVGLSRNSPKRPPPQWGARVPRRDRAVCACALHLLSPSCCYGNTWPGARGAKPTPGFRRSAKETPLPPRISPRRSAAPSDGPRPQVWALVPAGTSGHSAGPSGLDSGPVRKGTDGGPDGGWGESWDRVLGSSRQGLTFGKRRTRSGRGCWGRSCGGCPGGCYLCRREGRLQAGLGGHPIRLPDPQGGGQQRLVPLETSSEWAAPPSRWPRLPSEDVVGAELAQPLQVDAAFLGHSHAPPAWTLHSAPSPQQSSSVNRPPPYCGLTTLSSAQTPLTPLLWPRPSPVATPISCGHAPSRLAHAHHLSHPSVQAVGSGVAAAWAKCWSG